MSGGVRIGRILGFEVRLHGSWVLALALIAVTFANRLGEIEPTASSPIRWTTGIAVGLAFLITAVVHELVHAMVARRSGMPVGRLVVSFFGGTQDPTVRAPRPRDEIASALAGPLTSLAIAAVCVALAAALAAALGSAGDVVVLGVLVLGLMNGILGGVNLLPAFPLDGGRVVRGLAWARTGDPDRGLRTATVVGRWLGIALVLAGLVVVVLVDSVDGLMLALFGWFLASSARSIERVADIERLLEGIHVADVMEREVSGVPPGLTLDTFAAQVLDGSASPSLPVVQGIELLGMLGLTQIRRLRRDRWAQTRVGDLMVARTDVPDVAPETSLRAALEDLRRSGLDGLPVMQGGTLTGVLTRRAAAEAIQARMRATGMTSS